jgi:TRAP transporter 4TM/12TM fusion protein
MADIRGSAADGAAEPSVYERMPEEVAYRSVAGLASAIVIVGTLAMVALVLNQILNLGFFVGVTLLENQTLYMLGAVFLAIAFLTYPLRARGVEGGVPWYDWLLAAAALGITGYFAWTGSLNLKQGWEYAAPPYARYLAVGLWLIILEALRRTGGGVIAGIVAAISLYPIIASSVPGPIRGAERPFLDTMAFHMFSVESAFGIPMRAFGDIVVGFIVFGIALNHTGGGKFFNDIAFALVGKYRGGAAQVGVISSMLQGSISGSVISNVVSSGVVTIPAMKRTGFSSAYAGGVEAVASTGAVLMPPVMGSTAFVMASFLGMSYTDIALAAAIPGLLFYFGIAVQIDAYAARGRLGGLSAKDLIGVGQALREGWPYILVFAVLIYFMLEEKRESLAPFIATAVLLVINQLLPGRRMGWAQACEFALATGRGLAELVAILTGVGLIIGAFTMTGLAGTLANDLVFMAGGMPFVLLVMGALTSFLFGMGMTVTACYIFLAVILAPALVKQGMDPLAVHLFIMYWGMVSFITPPVALANFAAASIARASPFSIGWQAMKLGSVIYFVPFLFVYNPELLLKGAPGLVLATIVTSFIGVFFFASGLQGYVAGGGRADGVIGWLARLMLVGAGVLCGLAGIPQFGLTHVASAAIGIALGLAAIALLRAMGAERARFA